MNGTSSSEADIILVGAGIMSATLAVFLKELEPSLRIEIFEALDGAALESSDAWNNAGTGHAALCELNYTPERADGSVDISKALEVNTEFDLSRQLVLSDPEKGDRLAGSVHSFRAAYELRPRQSACRFSQEAPCRADGTSSLSGHGIYRRREDLERMGADRHGRPRRQRGRRRHPHDHRRRRELRRAHPQPHSICSR